MNITKQIVMMDESRISHTATLLPNGKILIFGGARRLATNSLNDLGKTRHHEACNTVAMLYDPSSKTFDKIAANVEIKCRINHIAVSTAEGNVLIHGGYCLTKDGMETKERHGLIYDWRMCTFKKTSITRISNTEYGLLLSSGDILLNGDYDTDNRKWYDWINPAFYLNGKNTLPYYTGEIYDYAQNMFTGWNSPKNYSLFINQVCSLSGNNIIYVDVYKNSLKQYDINSKKHIKHIDLLCNKYNSSKLYKIDNDNYVVVGGYFQSRGPYHAELINIVSGEINLLQNIKASNHNSFLLDNKIYYIDHYTKITSYYDIKKQQVIQTSFVDNGIYYNNLSSVTEVGNIEIVLIGGNSNNNQHNSLAEIAMDDSDIVASKEIITYSFREKDER